MRCRDCKYYNKLEDSDVEGVCQRDIQQGDIDSNNHFFIIDVEDSKVVRDTLIIVGCNFGCQHFSNEE